MVRRNRSMWSAVAVFVVVYFVVCAVAFAIQRSVLFQPRNASAAGPLTPWTEHGQVIGYCREVDQPKTVWLMMHGNAGQASDRDYVLEVISPSDSLYVLEYPGYGNRPGRPSRSSFDSAALDAYRFLCERYPDTPLGVIGESIGSGPASMLSSAQRPPDKVVLIVPFDALPRVASRHFPFFPMSFLLLDRWDNIQSLRSYQGAVDIYGARDDQIIPCDHARNLAKHCPGAEYHELDCGHNDWACSPAVRIAR